MSERPIVSSPSTSTVVDLDVSSIFVAPGRRKRALNLKDEKDLLFIQNIEQVGILQAIAVRSTPNAEKPYELVFGQRRLAIAKHLGMKTIPARVIPVTDQEMKFRMIAENAMRREMDHHEYQKLLTGLMKEMEAVFGPDPGNRNGAAARMTRARRDAAGRLVADDRKEDTEAEDPVVSGGR